MNGKRRRTGADAAGTACSCMLLQHDQSAPIHHLLHCRQACGLRLSVEANDSAQRFSEHAPSRTTATRLPRSLMSCKEQQQWQEVRW